MYGSFLTAALIAVDNKGEEIESLYLGIAREKMQITEPWVRENVLPKLGAYEACEDERELLKRAWDFWLKYREEAYAIADVAYPVECRFWQACVQLDEVTNAMLAPYPLLDLGSLLYSKGYDPLTDRDSLAEGFQRAELHNALYDARLAIEICKKRIREK